MFFGKRLHTQMVRIQLFKTKLTTISYISLFIFLYSHWEKIRHMGDSKSLDLCG